MIDKIKASPQVASSHDMSAERGFVFLVRVWVRVKVWVSRLGQ